MKLQTEFILGIDPGSRRTGYAFIHAQTKSVKLLRSGVLDVSKEKDFFKRIGFLHREMKVLIKGVEPFELALESLIYTKNANSLAKLAQARGVILAAAMEQAQCVVEYSPNLIKSSVSGYGLSSKESVQKALGFIFPNKSFVSDDESDALAVALCHHVQKGASFKKSAAAKGGSSLKSAFSHLDK